VLVCRHFAPLGYFVPPYNYHSQLEQEGGWSPLVGSLDSACLTKIMAYRSNDSREASSVFAPRHSARKEWNPVVYRRALPMTTRTVICVLCKSFV
jgi:hypothetical protein